MDQASSPDDQHNEATPIFGAYRRGYDPEQVDRYVADQQRRLDEATHRGSEAERKLAAAVGQLRELHRRVAVLESEDRSPQPVPLDTLGERVQRILQEAWEGAYALRQSTEQEMAELRERTAGEAEAIVVGARQRARAIEDEIERRRNAYLEQVEEDRNRAVAQITHLHHERDSALGELIKVKTTIEETVAEIARKHRPSSEVPDALSGSDLEPEVAARPAPAPQRSRSHRQDPPAPVAAQRRALESPAGRPAGDDLAKTMQVHRLDTSETSLPVPNPSELVRNHRAASPEVDPAEAEAPAERKAPLNSVQPAATVFDFEEEQP